MKKCTTYVALLRGINVGGNTIINMAQLKACFQQLGYRDITTYINSGNVIFRTDGTSPRQLEQAIEAAITAQFARRVTVIVHSLAEMAQLMAEMPKSWTTAGNQRCNVIFLRHAIDTPDIVKNFSPKPGIEELHYHPGVLFWSAQTSSLTKSNMLKASTLPIYQQMTVRIVGSARKIYALMLQTDALPANA